MAAKDAPTLGTEMTKELKGLLKELIETDDDIWNVAETAQVLALLRALRPAVRIVRSVGS